MGETNIFDFQELLDRSGCRIYVESGTGVGVCLSHMLGYGLDAYHSIDLDEGMIKRAIERFNQENVFFYNSLSTKALEKIVPALPKDVPVFFFLDAHFPDADFNGLSYEDSIKTHQDQAMPLFDEISIIKKHRDISKDVFVIDDWKLYDKDLPCQYGGWEHYNLQESLNLKVSKDCILEFFQKTHNINIHLHHQGFLFATPK